MADHEMARFVGEIAGLGTTSGHRLVIGRWVSSPFGSFADVMHESPAGLRTLHAPSTPIADFVATTYEFDDVVIEPIDVERADGTLRLRSASLQLHLVIGTRTPVGRVLRLVPARIARAPAWCTVVDPIARLMLDGVRTRGTAGNGRHEFYGATDQHRIEGVEAGRAGEDLGGLADVWPPVRFGFSSTPRRPGVVAVTTTIRWSPGRPGRRPPRDPGGRTGTDRRRP